MSNQYSLLGGNITAFVCKYRDFLWYPENQYEHDILVIKTITKTVYDFQIPNQMTFYWISVKKLSILFEFVPLGIQKGDFPTFKCDSLPLFRI